MYDTLRHIEDRQKALEESFRVLKSGGILCVIEWTEKSIRKATTVDGITIGFVDPREIITADSFADGQISSELLSGEWSNFFILRKGAA